MSSGKGEGRGVHRSKKQAGVCCGGYAEKQVR